MCVLTILPHNNGFILTSNRDESAKRAQATLPQFKDIGGQRMLMPIDPHAGGTWLAASETGRTIVLLNGAFQRHKHEPPYQKSRGLVVLDTFGYTYLDEFIEGYELEGIEPFTMVISEVRPERKITEIRWDEKQKYIKEVDAENPNLWQSATLYLPEIIKAREERFELWLAANADGISNESIHDFHFSERYDHETHQGEMENPHQLQTTSISQLMITTNVSQMEHEDLLDDVKVTETLVHV